ncbi:MAG: hypothetical protein L0209_08795 [candidate division Zixibacteria bacterium]|nr:hypothetical protein [candidate division Zixibacteria bacterium]
MAGGGADSGWPVARALVAGNRPWGFIDIEEWRRIRSRTEWADAWNYAVVAAAGDRRARHCATAAGTMHTRFDVGTKHEMFREIWGAPMEWMR